MRGSLENVNAEILSLIMESQLEKNMRNDMETSRYWSYMMGYSPNYGAIGSITAPNLWEYQNGTLISGTTHMGP